MTNGSAEYRAHAAHCREMAERAISPLDKEMWLRVAADWSQMASIRERYRTAPTENEGER
jgi:hypothetical protein